MVGEQHIDRWAAPDLRGSVAVVTGASRGVGRGVTLVLGECGATVYVTGRSVRGGPITATVDQYQGKVVQHTETVEETAELVTERRRERGGAGIAMRVDHTVDAEVEALFARVKAEQGRLDVLVNNVWGGYENMAGYEAPAWEQPIWRWDSMFDTGARAHFVAGRLAVPLMPPRRPRARGAGLIAFTGNLDQEATRCWHIASVAKLAANGLRCLLAEQLREHHVAVLTVSPIGRIPEWVWGSKEVQEVYDARRTPGGLETLHWKHPNRAGQSPEYTGRAVAMLAADPQVMAKTGQGFKVRDLAEAYDFTDIDGRRPRHD